MSSGDAHINLQLSLQFSPREAKKLKASTDPVVVGRAEQQILSCRMPLDKPHPPGVTNQGLPGLGEVLLDAADRDVPDLHLRAGVTGLLGPSETRTVNRTRCPEV